MAQSIIYTQTKRGVTLIELVLYMGIFVVLVGGVLYSAMYMQSILSYNSVEYKTQEQVYRQLDLLQQHMDMATKVEVGSGSIKIFGRYGYVEQYLDGEVLHIKYDYIGKQDLDIVPFPYLKFNTFSCTRETGHETLFGNSVLQVEIERMDIKGRVRILKEWLIAPPLPNLLL